MRKRKVWQGKKALVGLLKLHPVIVEHHMEMDDETTAHQLHKLLTDRGNVMIILTVLRCRKKLGWTFRG